MATPSTAVVQHTIVVIQMQCLAYGMGFNSRPFTA